MDFDFVPSSQPLQDGEDLRFSSPIGLRGISFSPQPWADGEPEYSKAGVKVRPFLLSFVLQCLNDTRLPQKMQTPPATPGSMRMSIKSPSSDTRPRRARLVRRASPVVRASKFFWLPLLTTLFAESPDHSYPYPSALPQSCTPSRKGAHM
jgi:hypothetical protein